MIYVARATVLALLAGITATFALAQNPPASPFGQAGNVTAPAATEADLEFAGVSSIGQTTMVNLYDPKTKRSFWVKEGDTASGVSVLKYDRQSDRVTVRHNGVEKTIALRAEKPVEGSPATAAAIPPAPATVAAPPSPSAPSPAPTGSTQLSQARQEEEARMLVSDLLEIGMAQRQAYEEAQRRKASGHFAQQNQAGQPTAPLGQAGAGATPPSTTPGAGAAPAPQPAPPTAGSTNR